MNTHKALKGTRVPERPGAPSRLPRSTDTWFWAFHRLSTVGKLRHKEPTPPSDSAQASPEGNILTHRGTAPASRHLSPSLSPLLFAFYVMNRFNKET